MDDDTPPSLTRAERVAWLEAHANRAADEPGQFTGPAPDEVLAACLRVLQTTPGWYSDPVLDPDGVLALVEAARGPGLDRDIPITDPTGWVQFVGRCPAELLDEFDAAAHLDERCRAGALRVAMRRYVDDDQ